MEVIITIVGFLGAGKTTLLKYLSNSFSENGWSPFIILNDYENANMDAQQFLNLVDIKDIKALTGSCICCSGINELRNAVNRIPKRNKGVTLIEANGTSDACALMEFLGVGLNEQFLPPIQIAVVDVHNWQKREEHNDLEANQVQVSSLIVLTHLKDCFKERKELVIKELKDYNAFAKIITMDEIDISLLPQLSSSNNIPEKLDYLKAHWSSCSVDLPVLPNKEIIESICKEIPKTILRVNGCTLIDKKETYTYFERTPDGQVTIRAFRGIPITGAKLLTIGPGSEPLLLKKIVESVLNEYKQTI
ncbi:cobalamin biosynthesis protein CobW [Polaribacter reichenbachii]|uniref:Cobalamin biosynthesis protein CobW n=1 Tax=Polaribacter reichenbachii TaxID=996801 RepID=A0A1B8U456_9FLAO|nr:GTP-binding protein [Polaribacter reichenbachii]APZ47407.1 cobalamin biosynthesis protein CobW [Polaribacter reichenbachii]AUC18046.1 cobalamin biosynthesis protein CobW [Polaribacter reichenbachii]OBY66656.1 cobalamin biosynthesis protein CobW [Polaribacter reichenbachii]